MSLQVESGIVYTTMVQLLTLDQLLEKYQLQDGELDVHVYGYYIMLLPSQLLTSMHFLGSATLLHKGHRDSRVGGRGPDKRSELEFVYWPFRRATSCCLPTNSLFWWFQWKPDEEWNKFDSWVFLLASLPRKMNSQLQNIHLASTSNRVDAIQHKVCTSLSSFSVFCLPTTCHCSKLLVDDLLKLEDEGVVMYDHQFAKEVLVFAPVL